MRVTTKQLHHPNKQQNKAAPQHEEPPHKTPPLVSILSPINTNTYAHVHAHSETRDPKLWQHYIYWGWRARRSPWISGEGLVSLPPPSNFPQEILISLILSECLVDEVRHSDFKMVDDHVSHTGWSSIPASTLSTRLMRQQSRQVGRIGPRMSSDYGVGKGFWVLLLACIEKL